MSPKFSYESLGEMMMPNGFNVAFTGYIRFHGNDLDNEGIIAGTVENRGDGGCNIYHWSTPALKKLFELTAREVITSPTFHEIEDEFVEYLYEQAVGVTL